MNYITIIPLFAIPAYLLYVFVIVPRRQMEERASALLAEHSGAEQISVYLKLRSTFARKKQREIDAKIAEMQPQGWTFLRATVAKPQRTLFSWGGGLMLHFIRTKV
jgi:hypothetical protein